MCQAMSSDLFPLRGYYGCMVQHYEGCSSLNETKSSLLSNKNTNKMSVAVIPLIHLYSLDEMNNKIKQETFFL